ncbi:MAG TPA: TraX family protein [Clostridia bacterium]
MLKLIACVLMLIDHVGYFFYDFLPLEISTLLRVIGRLAFPIFAYSVALGYRRTRSQFRYLRRMLVFALLTEGILRIAAASTGFSFSPNVLITFTTAILFLIGYELATRSFHDMIATMKLARAAVGPSPAAADFQVRISFGGTGLTPSVGFPVGVLLSLAALTANLLISPDYGLYGLLSVWIFHQSAARIPTEEPDPAGLSALKNRTWTGMLALNLAYLPYRVLIEQVPFEWSLLQCLSVMAIPLILARWPDRKPGLAMKYGFYLFYPAHIVLLMVIARLMY